MASNVTLNRFYRYSSANGWTYVLSQEHQGRIIFEVTDGRPPYSGAKHLAVADDGRLTGLYGGDFDPPVTVADLIDTGHTWESIEPRAGWRAFEEYKNDYRPSSPLHFGCDHQDAPCQEAGEEHVSCQQLGWDLCSQCH